jgi:hypothetical protein
MRSRRHHQSLDAAFSPLLGMRKTKWRASQLLIACALQTFIPKTMIAHTALKPKPITELPSTCANCRYFSDFGDERGRGLYRVFDTVARRHHQKNETCFSEIAILEREDKPAFLVGV